MKRSRTRRLSGTLLVLGVAGALLAGGTERVSAQTALRWGRTDAGSTQPILVNADEVTSWPDGGQRIFLLRGRVTLEQGAVRLRAQQGVVWVDEAARQQTGAFRLEVYAEGDVVLDDGPRTVTQDGPAPRALIGLATRGEVKLRAYGKRIAYQPAPADPIYRNALAERQGSSAPQRVTAQNRVPAAPRVDPNLQRTGAQEPTPPPAPPGFVPAVPTQGPPGGGLPPGVVAVPPAPAAPLPAPPVLPAPVPPAPFGQGAVPAVPPGGAVEEPPPPRPLEPPFEAGPPSPQVIIRPRSSQAIAATNYPLPSGETAVVISSGVIITINDIANKGMIDIEADRAVLWTRGDFQHLLKDGAAPGQEGLQNRQMEFYLCGHVEIRQESNEEARLLRADEMYYDVHRGVAIARDADLVVQRKGMPDPLHLQGPELLQLNPKLFQMNRSSVNASKLPYDPNLKLTLGKASLEEIEVPKRGLFGLGAQRIDPVTGQPVNQTVRLFRGRNAVLWIGGVPVFYLPYIRTNADDPLGPLEALAFNYNRIFGFQAFVTWDLYDLLGLTPTPGTRWRLHTDYMSERGPALGTDYIFTGTDLLGIPNRYNGTIRAYGMQDVGVDVLGGSRGEFALVPGPTPLTPPTFVPITHPEFRGIVSLDGNVQGLPLGFSSKWKVNALSDRNFSEQFFNYAYWNELDQETWGFVKQQNNNWAWTLFGQARLRNWMTETEWMPRLDGFLIGEKFFDLFTYNAWGSAGYAHLQPTHQPPPPVYSYSDINTERDVATGRFDLRQEISLPFPVYDLKVVPYVVGDLTYYSEDVYGSPDGRAYGGGGVRTSLPLSRLYPEIQSELWNLNGIFHKIVFSANYFNAYSSTPYEQLPQLDRLNDAVTDQTLRNFRPRWREYNPGYGLNLYTNRVFDPQTYAIRRLIDSKLDTLDTIEVLQLDARQRWQTKRGYPGQQHVVDWMTLGLSASYFPNRARDNFGESFSFLQYDYLWFLGDRFTFFSDGWFEPLDQGARMFTIGMEANRYDNNRLSLMYRHIDPIQSRTVLASFTYVFSPKYAVTAGTSYDFGNKVQTNMVMVTRTGTDLQLSAGLSHNSTVNTVSFNFEIFPILLPTNRRQPGALGNVFQNMGSPR
ncbi:MAG: hypothetical protein IT429_25780 [Gemmataceae bacterium]|nr:hypothetical protein [Gemmataceae bacterium]